jgi:hypothetical protein
MYGTFNYNSGQYNAGGGLYIILSLNESEAASDAVIKYLQMSALEEEGTVSDDLVKQPRLTYTESQAETDILAKMFQMARAESGTISDMESAVYALEPFVETQLVAAELMKQANLSLQEFQFAFDVIRFDRYKFLSEKVRMNDWLEIGRDPKTWY